MFDESFLKYGIQFITLGVSAVFIALTFILISNKKEKAASVVLTVFMAILGIASMLTPALFLQKPLPFIILNTLVLQLMFCFAMVIHVVEFDLNPKSSIFLFVYQALAIAVFSAYAHVTQESLFIFPLMFSALLLIFTLLLHNMNIRTIFAREIRSFFVSPLYYVLGFVYLWLTGFFFSIDLHYIRMAVMENSFNNIGFFSNFFLSILCINLISQERASGTFEIVMTSPINALEFVLGKYLSVLLVYMSFLTITVAYPTFLSFYGSPDIGVLLSGYTGLFLLGTAILGLGLIATSLTRSQLVVAILGVSLPLLMYILNWAADMFFKGRNFLRELSLTEHITDFTMGMIDMEHVVFFMIWLIGCITLSTLIVESYKWR